jgi:hypothetical protein
MRKRKKKLQTRRADRIADACDLTRRDHAIQPKPKIGNFRIDYVEIIGVPSEEAKSFEGQVYASAQLPADFTVEPTWGDAFLAYKSDGTLKTACRRHFYMASKSGKRWLQWPFMKWVKPLTVQP